MPRALFTSKNLIGDGLYIQPALEEWAKDHPDWDIHLLTNDDHVACIYEHMGIPNLKQIEFGRTHREYDFEFVFNVNEAFKISDRDKCHISTAYGKMLGYGIERTGKPWKGGYVARKVRFDVSDKQDHPKGLILLSMFSASCASREGKAPNKMLSWAHWNVILNLVRQYGPLASLGGPADFPQLPLSEDEICHALPLELTARMMRDAKALITLDNGMAHLGATQETNTVEFYPACLGTHYIVPSGNPNLYVQQMDPTMITPSDAGFFVREALSKMWGMK